ncbi:MAG: hypothetical protein ACYC9J_03820 [Sulfuricaulis sp.]
MTAAGRVIALVLIFGLSACQGGGGSAQSSTTTTLNNIAFNAASPDMPTPASQTFNATVNAGTILVTIQHNGPAITSASYTLSGTTAQIVVNPPAPNSLGAGNFTGVISVTGYSCGNPACSQLAAGNTQIVHVTYQIPPIVRFVAPYVGVAGTAGSVFIRGQGFEQFAVQNVIFGTTAATSFTVVSDTEIQASYRALPASTTPYPVQIQVPTSPSPITSLANLIVVNPPTCTPAPPAVTYITYPAPFSTPTVKDLVYDAERQALLVADSSDGEILRFLCSGSSWGAQTSAAINTLSDIALSTDGRHLLALSQTTLGQLKPDTLATDATTPAPAFATAGTVFKNIAVGNDGNAVVTTAFPNTSTATWLYDACDPLNNPANSPCLPAFLPSQPPSTPNLDNAIAAAPTDGSLIVFMHGDSTLTTPPSVFEYVAQTDTYYPINVLLNQNSVAPTISSYTPPNSTSSTRRIVLSGTNTSNIAGSYVFDSNYNTLLGTLPSSTLAVVVNPDITRAYTYDSSNQVLSFDLTATPAGGPFPQVGPGITLAGPPDTGVRMAISPDGSTLFLAGSNRIVVLQSPP